MTGGAAKTYALLRAYNQFVLDRVRANPKATRLDVATDAVEAIAQRRLLRPTSCAVTEVKLTFDRLSYRQIIKYDPSSKTWAILRST